MSNILQELTKTNDKWAANSQSNITEATIVSLGNSSTAYTIELKNGARVSNISGPAGLSVGNAVVVSSYPGQTKKYVILQRTSGGGVSSSITTVEV